MSVRVGVLREDLDVRECPSGNPIFRHLSQSHSTLIVSPLFSFCTSFDLSSCPLNSRS